MYTRIYLTTMFEVNTYFAAKCFPSLLHYLHFNCAYNFFKNVIGLMHLSDFPEIIAHHFCFQTFVPGASGTVKRGEIDGI